MDLTNSSLQQGAHWLWTHAILLAVVVLLGFGSTYFVESLIAKRDASAAAGLHEIVSVLQKQNDTTQAQNQHLQDEIDKLALSVTQRNAQNTKQQKNDASLSAKDAAGRLAAQTNAQSGEITVAGDLVTIDLPITRFIVGSLDDLLTTKANLVDTQTALETSKRLVTSQSDLLNSRVKELDDTKKACAQDLKVATDNARKGKLKWFAIGFGTGYVAGKITQVLKLGL